MKHYQQIHEMNPSIRKVVPPRATQKLERLLDTCSPQLQKYESRNGTFYHIKNLTRHTSSTLNSLVLDMVTG